MSCAAPVSSMKPMPPWTWTPSEVDLVGRCRSRRPWRPGVSRAGAVQRRGAAGSGAASTRRGPRRSGSRWRARPPSSAFIVSSMRCDVGMLDDRARRLGGRRRPALPALAAHRRAPAGSRARRPPTPCRPTPRRALFIIVNMQARPLFSSPISQPMAPPLSPNAIDAGRRGVDAELVLDAGAAQVVARRSPSARAALRHQEQRDAPRAGGRVGQAGQHQVDDVVGEIVLAIGDEDLLAGDPVGAVARRARPGSAAAPRSEPACGSVRFIVPVHSPETSLAR